MPLGANKVALFGASGIAKPSAILLSTATASSSAYLEFTLPTAYKQVTFGFDNITPATDNSNFQFDCSVSSSYGTTKTTTYFESYHNEADSSSGLTYITAQDLAQSTSNQSIFYSMGNGADECGVGELFLFNPASTTYVKQFYAKGQYYYYSNASNCGFIGGYFNTTSALDGIKFLMSSGNIASGTIKMWGIK
jgi:hypothetical protein